MSLQVVCIPVAGYTLVGWAVNQNRAQLVGYLYGYHTSVVVQGSETAGQEQTRCAVTTKTRGVQGREEATWVAVKYKQDDRLLSQIFATEVTAWIVATVVDVR